jgi:hypothetical protein
MNDFEKGFLAGFIGYWLGYKIDQTRFGIWFNNNPVIDFIWNVLVAALQLIVIGLAIYFVYLVIAGWS